MKVCWSEKKKGYIIYKAGIRNPLYINGWPVVGYFSSAFFDDARNENPATNAFEALFSETLKRVSRDMNDSDGVTYSYDDYILELINGSLIVEVQEKTKYCDMDFYTTKLEINVKFDGKNILEKELEFIEGEISGNIDKKLSILLSGFLYFFIHANSLENDLIKDFQRNFPPKMATELIQQYTQFFKLSYNDSNEKCLFYNIKYFARFDDDELFYLETSKPAKKKENNNYISPQITNPEKKSCIISDIFEETNENKKNRYIFIGEYPQEALTWDEGEIKRELDNIKVLDRDGYKNYKGLKYLAVKTGPFKDRITYFRISPIKFKILYETDDKILIMSDKIIDKYNHNHFFTPPTNNYFLLKMFLSNFSSEIFEELISLDLFCDRFDYGEHGFNFSKLKYGILANSRRYIRDESPQVNDQYLCWNDADNFWRDYDRFLPLFSRIKPVHNELSRILSDNIAGIDFKFDFFLIKLNYRDFLSEKLSFQEGIATQFKYSYGRKDKSRQAVMTEFAKEQGASNVYYCESERKGYMFIEGEEGTIYKKDDFDRDAIFGFRPILILQKKCIGKTVILEEDGPEWERFSSTKNEITEKSEICFNSNLKCKFCDSVLENDKWCPNCEEFIIEKDNDDYYDYEDVNFDEW